jgi:hypothetical protein
MAKKKQRPGNGGGRVTPKGTRPPDAKAGHQAPADGVDHRPISRTDPGHARPAAGPSVPTRAGHHRGQR